MKSLGQVLSESGPTAKPQERITQTASAGCETMVSSAPMSSLPTLEQRAGELVEKPTGSSGSVPSPAQQKDSVLSSQETRKLLTFLDTTFAVLDTYGRKPDQLEEIAMLFVVMLKGYPLEKIKDGFMQHMRRSSKMPTPADIINIIDPLPPEPWKPDWAVYVGMKQQYNRGNLSHYSEGYAYIKRCERWSMDALKDYDKREETRKEIEQLEGQLAIEDKTGDSQD